MAGCGALGAFDTCRPFAVAFYLPGSALIARGGDAITGLGRGRLVARTSGCRTEGSERRNHGCHFFAGQNREEKKNGGVPSFFITRKTAKRGEFNDVDGFFSGFRR